MLVHRHLPELELDARFSQQGIIREFSRAHAGRWPERTATPCHLVGRGCDLGQMRR
jgi:hypothetical protein